MKIVAVLLIEPDPIRRRGLRFYLEREEGIQVLGVGSGPREALEAGPPGAQVDVVLVDADAFETSRMRFWATLRSVLPGVPVAALTRGLQPRVLEHAVGVGVTALYPTDAAPDVIGRALRNASEGVMDVHPELARRLQRFLQAEPSDDVRIGKLTIDPTSHQVLRGGKPVQLTPREWEVLALIREGRSNRQIGQRLFIQESTVAFHVSNILEKLGVSSRIEAGLVAQWLA